MATKPIWTTDQIINQINSGDTWPQLVITYNADGLARTGTEYSFSPGIQPMTDQEKTMANYAFTYWDDLIVPTLQPGDRDSNISFNYSTDVNSSEGGATEHDGGSPGAGISSGSIVNVWINANYAWTAAPNFGSHAFWGYLHEIGHSLGLNHPGPYNAGDGRDIEYSSDALYAQDTDQFTVMSILGSGIMQRRATSKLLTGRLNNNRAPTTLWAGRSLNRKLPCWTTWPQSRPCMEQTRTHA
jgi:serralysin